MATRKSSSAVKLTDQQLADRSWVGEGLIALTHSEWDKLESWRKTNGDKKAVLFKDDGDTLNHSVKIA